MYNSTVCVFLRLPCSYTFRRNRHLQGAYTKISLKRTVINSFTINIHANSAGFDKSHPVALHNMIKKFIQSNIIYIYIHTYVYIIINT